jgi:hypothetical protein
MRRLALALAVLAAACTVPDKFFTDAGGGDDTIDGGSDLDAAPDTTAPETTITDGPDPFDASSTATFEFSADEPATFTCSVDGSAPTTCTSPFSANVADGPHTFQVRATDLSGNEDPTPAEEVWTTDTVAPDTTFTTTPPAVDNSTSVSFPITSNESGVSFECGLDAGGFTPCTVPHPVNGLAEGSHTFRSRAIDQAGNVDASPATHTWMVDTSSPDTQIDGGPTGSVDSTIATFMFSSPNAGVGATYACSLDGAAYVACTSPRTYGGLSETSHTFAVRVTDAALNTDPTPATRMWTVDTTDPTTTIMSGPSGAVPSQSATFVFTSNEAGATFECDLDSGGFGVCSATHLLTSLSQGSHTLQVRAVDAALNVDATPASRTWTVDTVSPDTSFVSGPPPSSTSSMATFDLGSTETGVTYECELDAGGYSACADPHTITVGDGSHTRRARAIDAAGNVDGTPAGYSWSVDTSGPVVTITAGPVQNSTTGPYVEFFFTYTSGTVRCYVDGTLQASCVSPVHYNLPHGPHNFKVEATDGSMTGNDERSWNVNCAPPAADAATIGLFHMDEMPPTQTVGNSASGFPSAVLGPTATAEPTDCQRFSGARFNNGLQCLSSGPDVVTWPTNLNGVGSLTVEMWVRTGTTGPVVQELFTSQDRRFQVRAILSGGLVSYEIGITNDAGTTGTVGPNPVAPGVWRHIIASYDASGPFQRIWVDGVRATGSSSVITGGINIGATKIGGGGTGAPAPSNGDIDEVWVQTSAIFDDSQALPRYCPAP